MAGWLALMLLVAVAGREATRDLNVFQIMEIRSATLGLVMLYPLIRLAGGFTALRTSRLRMHASRGLLHYAAQLGWFFALTLIPLGQLVSIEFTSPIWTAILAASFGERMTIWKISAIALGLIGVFVIVRPATGEINPGQLIALAAAVGFGTSVAMMKSLTRTEATVAIVFWMLAVQVVVGALPTLYVWVWPSPYVWACAIAVAVSGTFSHFCMARAMLYADATIVLPMDFLRDATAAAGWLIYAERMDAFTVLGALLILTGNLLNLKPPAARTALVPPG